MQAVGKDLNFKESFKQTAIQFTAVYYQTNIGDHYDPFYMSPFFSRRPQNNINTFEYGSFQIYFPLSFQ